MANKIDCLFCKSEASVEVRCKTCGEFIRYRLCPTHAAGVTVQQQRFIDAEFPCGNPKCGKCDHEYALTNAVLNTAMTNPDLKAALEEVVRKMRKSR